MDRLKRTYSYATRIRDYEIRFRTDQPENSFQIIPDQPENSFQIIPDDMQELLGKTVVTTTTMDADLNHCLATGNSSTGCLHFVNKTPVDWY